MKVFGPIYERTLRWAQHRNATGLLAFLSFIEAIFFPIPPEVMLAPMCLARPKRGFWFAGVSLAASMAGGRARGAEPITVVSSASHSTGACRRRSAQRSSGGRRSRLQNQLVP